jgi:hypothetical protein
VRHKDGDGTRFHAEFYDGRLDLVGNIHKFGSFLRLNRKRFHDLPLLIGI